MIFIFATLLWLPLVWLKGLARPSSLWAASACLEARDQRMIQSHAATLSRAPGCPFRGATVRLHGLSSPDKPAVPRLGQLSFLSICNLHVPPQPSWLLLDLFPANGEILPLSFWSLCRFPPLHIAVPRPATCDHTLRVWLDSGHLPSYPDTFLLRSAQMFNRITCNFMMWRCSACLNNLPKDQG